MYSRSSKLCFAFPWRTIHCFFFLTLLYTFLFFSPIPSPSAFLTLVLHIVAKYLCKRPPYKRIHYCIVALRHYVTSGERTAKLQRTMTHRLEAHISSDDEGTSSPVRNHVRDR